MDAFGQATGLGLFAVSSLVFRPLGYLGNRESLKRSAAVFSASKWAERLLGDFHSLTTTNPEASNSSSFTAPNFLIPPHLSPSEDRYVPIPLHFYQLLGAEIHFLADGIRRAYDAKVSKAPQYGFSQEALISRRKILQAACETLTNSQSRRDYNLGLLEDETETIVTEVPWNKVPGALLVLLESGKTEEVLSMGDSLLKERLPKWFKQDVVLVMALAFVDLSRDAMALQLPSFLNASEYLERALKLLQEEGASSLAPDLRSQIDDTLEEIAPRCVLERLALPLDEEHRKMRGEGLVGMRNILWTVGGGGAAPLVGGFTREDFMSKAFSLMATSEQVDLFNTTPENIPPEDFEAYSVALAIVVQAFVGKKPSLIPNASNLFEQLQKQSTHEMDFALEIALCSLLVGKLDECRMWLGLDSETSPYRDPSIVDFVVESSRGDDDESDLPGLCMLLETWLREVVFPRFRDCENITFKLGDYYDDPSVLRHLEKMAGEGSSPLSAAAAIVRIGADEATTVIGHVKSSAIVALQKVFPASSPAGDDVVREESDEASIFSKTRGSIVLLVSGIVAVSAVAIALIGMKGVQRGGSGAAVVDSNEVLAAVNSGEVLAAGERMSGSVAESIVRKWQRIKSEAMGAEHRVENMSEVLDGEMLRVWRERAAEVKGRGWVYGYRLLDLRIESVTVALDGKSAVVEATLNESAALSDCLKPDNNASNVHKYTARYDFALTQTGWKIVDGALIM